MKVNNIHRVIFYIVLIISLFFLKFGRSVWHPIYIKIKGRRTVEDVYAKKGPVIEQKLKSYFFNAGAEYLPESLTFIALKDEQKLELWATNNGIHKYIKQYQFTSFSGKLGPKLKSGDLQIPEGIYKIEYLNPNSSYYLSMKISYPNSFDLQAAKQDKRADLGGDIFIHGKAVTIGCIPIGDSGIEELFILTHLVGKDNVTVIISPNDLRTDDLKYHNSNLPWLNEKYIKINKALTEYKH